MHIILILYTFLKIEVRLVLTGGVHTGGQHMPGGRGFPGVSINSFMMGDLTSG